MLLSIFLTEYDAAIQTIYQILATWQNALLFCEKGKIGILFLAVFAYANSAGRMLGFLS